MITVIDHLLRSWTHDMTHKKTMTLDLNIYALFFILIIKYASDNWFSTKDKQIQKKRLLNSESNCRNFHFCF